MGRPKPSLSVLWQQCPNTWTNWAQEKLTFELANHNQEATLTHSMWHTDLGGQTFPARYYFRILVVSQYFALLHFKIQNRWLPNFLMPFSVIGSPLEWSRFATFATSFFCLIQYLSSHWKIPSRLQTNYSAAVAWVSISPPHKKSWLK